MTTPSTTVRPADPTLRAAVRLALLFAAVKLLLQFALTLYTQHIGYGYFRDEFYYIACGRHLAWGFVDHGPIVAVQARIGELLFGDSLFAIRTLSAVAGAVMVFLGGLITWALGGRRPAQALAMLGLICAPIYIALDGFLSMNSCEAMFWISCILALLFLLRGHSPARWWTFFGIAGGLGLLNKPSMVFFLIALGIGLLCTPERKVLFTRWAALGIALLLVIALPNLIWQMTHHWATLEFLHNGRVEGKNTALGPLQFFGAQVLAMHPINTLLWITGIVALLRAMSIARARWLGITYLVFYAIMFALHAKDYYLAPIYPALFAAGAIAWEHRFSASRSVQAARIYAFPIFESVLIVTTLIILPMSSPIFTPETWVRYTTTLHLQRANDETEKTSALPQFYADRFGWQELAGQVVATYRTLSPEDQAQACIYASNYGEAGAIDFLGKMQEPRLPPAISGHNNYWLWGTHGCNGKVILSVTGASLDDLHNAYGSVQAVATMNNPYAMPFENRTIYLLRNRHDKLDKDWPDFKHYF